MVHYKYLFPYLKYISPIWYFNLKCKKEIPYWVDYSKLERKDKDLLNFDYGYSSHYVSLLDAAYQGWQKGIIEFDISKALDIKSLDGDVIMVEDEYHFLKKYYGTIWSLYVFFIRVLTLHNPFKEFIGFLKNIKTKKEHLYSKVKSWDEIKTFNSTLLNKKPLVSVIIPTLNRYRYLDDVLKDLESQDYKNFEVIVCDQSEPVDEKFYEARNLNLKLIKQEEKALWLARNRSIKESRGEYILLFDDDSRVDPDWISSHLRCIDFFNVEISSGVSLSVVGGKTPENYSFYRWGDQVDTGNAMIHKDVFRQIGLFDRQFEKQRMGDGEFGIRSYLAGIKNICNPDAKRIHLKVGTGGLRQMGHWDAFRTKGLFSPKPIPSSLYLFRKYFGNDNAIFTLLISLPFGVVPYKYKNNRFFKLLSIPLSFILFPIVFIQVYKSWKIATHMLEEGAKIEVFNDKNINGLNE